MKRIFIGLTVAALATILVPMSVHANALAFDAAGNLYVADPSRHSVFKYTPDGTKSSFAAGHVITPTSSKLPVRARERMAVCAASSDHANANHRARCGGFGLCAAVLDR